MSARDPRIPTIFGALDSSAIGDGDQLSAHVLRTMEESANRMLARGEPLLNYAWDVGGAATETPSGGMSGWGWPMWTQILPGPMEVRKQPGLTRAKLYVYAYARSSETLLVQIATRQMPFDASADENSPNVCLITGNGAFQWFELDGIWIDAGVTESVTAYLRSAPTTTLATAGGGTNSGTVDRLEEGGGVVVDVGAGWSTTSTTRATTGQAIQIIGSVSGNPIASPRWITNVVDSDRLRVFPQYSAFEQFSFEGANYRIYELPRWRLGSLALYAKDRV